jgi:Gly-Xaa carboxypeptidase
MTPKATAKSTWPKVLLGVLVLLATATHLGPKLASTSAPAGIEAVDLRTGIFDPVVYDEAWLKEHTKCPVQPRPLPPKLTWNLTAEERAESLKKFSAAVVSASRALCVIPAQVAANPDREL